MYRGLDRSLFSQMLDHFLFFLSCFRLCWCTIISLETEIRRDEDRLQASKTAALDLIGRIPNPEYQTVLISRYFRSKTWEEISQEMYYSISWIYRLHGYALEALNGILAGECS